MSEIEEFRSVWHAPNALYLPPVKSLDGLIQPGVLPEEVRSSPEGAFEIIGQYAAFIVVYYLDSTVARACLAAPHLELGPSHGTPQGKHPAMCSFGSHQGVHPRFFNLWNYDYAEALVGIPDVLLRHRDGSTSGPYFYMTAVRLNNQFADEIGEALGFPKKMAVIESSNVAYSIRMSANESPIMTGSFAATGGVFGPDYPNFKTIAQLALQQPVISRTPAGQYLVTSFHIDTDTATMMPMRGDIRIADNSLSGLPAKHYQFPGIDTQAIGGGYYSIHNWVMGVPKPIEV